MTAISRDVACPAGISIHTSPKGGDPYRRAGFATHSFQSTPPRREVTHSRRERLAHAGISIHTSPKGGDEAEPKQYRSKIISIHTSPKGGDQCRRRPDMVNAAFQSTPPRREVTRSRSPTSSAYQFQSTPPRREVTRVPEEYLRAQYISIHTSPKGGDSHPGWCSRWSQYFNPHLPEGR